MGPAERTFLYGKFSVCFYHVTYTLRGNLHSILEWVSRNRLLKTGTISEIWVTERHWKLQTDTRILNYLAKVVNSLRCIVVTPLYGALTLCFILSHTRSEYIHTLWLPDCQGTPCSKQVQYLKLKWLQRDWQQNHLVHRDKFSRSAKMVKS